MSPAGASEAPSSWPSSALLRTRWRKADEIVASTSTSATSKSQQLIQTKYESPKTQFKRSNNPRCRCRRAFCGRLRRDGINQYNIAAVGGWLPRPHPANAKATADVPCPATLQSRARDGERKSLLRL